MSQDKKSSKISGFYKMPVKDRVEIVKKFADLSSEEANQLSKTLDFETADRVIENVIGVENEVGEKFSDIRGQMVKTKSVLFKDIVLQLKIKTFESSGVYYFLDGAVIKLGNRIWIHFSEILAGDAEIIKIIE